eukprot:TRINITY_DN13599_c2_g1_i1.p1 TRINITY_DN13599_c2_g1~~TRINITY_DN13599_c2_g1_i1.p1  ORF type:complete len:310 (+),score=88.41 TRINITY_DN13599_c2_g1_i1:98-931(+)
MAAAETAAGVDHYVLLGVEPSASAEDIRRAYRRAALAVHPDHNPGASPRGFQRLATAYGVLGDSAARRQYDAERRKRARTFTPPAGGAAAACAADSAFWRRPPEFPFPEPDDPLGGWNYSQAAPPPRPPPRRRRPHVAAAGTPQPPQQPPPPEPPPRRARPPPQPRDSTASDEEGGGADGAFGFTWVCRRRVVTSYPLRESDVRDLREQMAKDLWAAQVISVTEPQSMRSGFQAAERACRRHAAAVQQQRLRDEAAAEALRDLKSLFGGGHIGPERV